MNDRVIAIVDTGVANIFSLVAMLDRIGYASRLVTDSESVAAASHLILPGVGTFGAAIGRIDELGIRQSLVDRVQQDKATLCVCLGLQLLAESSEESPGVRGLGLIPSTVRRFDSSVKVPQLGWNSVIVSQPGVMVSGSAFFANSLRIETPPDGWNAAITDYGGKFVSAISRGKILACQFHPELSGEWGQSLVQNWISQTSSLTRRVIPCLDVRDGRVVKGIQFRNLRDAGDPGELAAAYCAQGADELVMLDVSATRESRLALNVTITRIRRQISIPLTVGGGVQSIADAGRLLEAGADKVSVNSAAVRRPDLLNELSAQFGAQCVVLAIDAKRDGSSWQVLTRSGEQRESLDAVTWGVEGTRRGAGEILLTSHDRDGTGAGYDCDLLSAVAENTSLPVIASGGAKTVDDFVRAFRSGAHAVLAATIFHDGETTVDLVKRELSRSGVNVRL